MRAVGKKYFAAATSVPVRNPSECTADYRRHGVEPRLFLHTGQPFDSNCLVVAGHRIRMILGKGRPVAGKGPARIAIDNIWK